MGKVVGIAILAAFLSACVAQRPAPLLTGPPPAPQRQSIGPMAKPVPTATLRIAPARKLPPLPRQAWEGFLACSGCGFEADIISDAGYKHYVAKVNEPVSLPPGECIVRNVCFVSADSGGKIWRVRRPLEAETVVIRLGLKATLPSGPPFTTSLKAVKREGNVIFTPVITGRAGEVYSVGSVINPRRNVSPPSITICDAAGKRLGGGQFEFG